MKDLEVAGDVVKSPTVDIDFIKIIEDISAEVDCLPINLHTGDRVKSCLSSGCLVVDLLIGGGYGKGRWTTVFGPEGSGKSTLVYHAIDEGIKRGLRVLHFAHEASDDPAYMKTIGIPLDNPEVCKSYYRYYQPDVGEQTFKLISKLLNKLPDSLGDDPPSILIVIDSLAAMMSEIETDDKHPMAAQARMFSTWMRSIKSRLGRKGAIIFAVNQLRMDPNAWGNPETEPGGWATRFYPDIKIRISTVGSKIDAEGGHEYRWVKLRTTKNKQFAPFQSCDEYRIRLGKGFDPIYDTYQYLLMTGQMQVHGSWYHFDGDIKEAAEAATGSDKFQWKNNIVLENVPLREACRAQLMNGTAFKLYFAHKGIITNAPVRAPIEAEDETEENSGEGTVTEV